MGFRLVPTSITLNDLERRNSPYFAFFSRNSTVVEDRPIMCVKYCLSVPVFYFWRKLFFLFVCFEHDFYNNNNNNNNNNNAPCSAVSLR